MSSHPVLHTADRPSEVHVLVTVDMPSSFVDAVASTNSRVRVHVHPCEPGVASPPPDVVSVAEVLYTDTVLPTAGAAPVLRWVQLDTSGVDHVRDSDLWSTDAVITTLGGVSPSPLAEWVLLMVLSHAHRLRETEHLQSRRHWPTREERWKHLMPVDLRRATMGIVGYGRIGQEVARLARSFGMRVEAVRRMPDSERPHRFGIAPIVEGVSVRGPEALPDVLADSDYLVLTVPLTHVTKGLIGAAELGLMRPGVVIVNASRGDVVDELALLQALDDGRVDLVASDVFSTEPLPPDHPLWTHPRSLVTPHVAGFAPDYLDAVTKLFTANLRRYLDGSPLLNVADRAAGY